MDHIKQKEVAILLKGWREETLKQQENNNLENFSHFEGAADADAVSL